MIIEIIGTILVISFINVILSLFNKKTNLLSCGIVGFSGLGNYNLDKIKALLLWNSVERGEDATGIFTPLSGLHKDNDKAKRFLTGFKMNKIESDSLLIAHVRKKSIGVNSATNAHPFETDNYVMCHNGTLSNYLDLEEVYNIDVNKYQTDSQILSHCLSENYDDDEEYKVLGQYEGAAAILAYNKDNEKLIAARDYMRPLYYGYIDKTEMYISSIKESLELIGCKDIKEFLGKKIYEIYNGEIVNTLDFPKNVEIRKKFKINAAVTNDYISCNNSKLPAYMFTQNKHFNGLMYACCFASHISGYYIRYTGVTIGYKIDTDKPSLTKNNWYYVLPDKNNVQVKNIIIIDDNGDEKQANLWEFDTRNFIPIPGYYVRLTSNIYIKDGTEQVGNKNEVVLVTKHEWLDTLVHVKNEFTGKVYNIPTYLCRVITEEEHKVHEQELLDYNQIVKGTFSNSQSSLFNQDGTFNGEYNANLPLVVEFPSKSKTVNTSTEAEYVEENKDITESKVIELDSPDFITSESVIYLLGLLEQSVTEIQDSLLNKENIDNQIDLLHHIILNCYDVNYIESLNEDDTEDDTVEEELEEDNIIST